MDRGLAPAAGPDIIRYTGLVVRAMRISNGIWPARRTTLVILPASDDRYDDEDDYHD
jgi:hypothetical protein